MKKILFMADIHMSNRLPYAKPVEGGLTDRLQDQLELWKWLNEYIRDEKVDALYILGDLFDRSLVDPVTLTETVNAVVDCECMVFLLAGNHDANSAKGSRYIVEVFDAMRKKNVVTIGQPYHPTLLDLKPNLVKFWSIPFLPADDTGAHIEKIRREWISEDDINILLLHNSILGAEHRKWICDQGLDADFVCEDFDLVLSGHFHAAQEFGDCGQYLGAPMQHDFGDVGNVPGVWLFEFSEEDMEYNFIENDFSPRFHIRKIGVEDDKIKVLKGATSYSKGDYVRFEVELTHAEFIKRKPAIESLIARAKKKGLKASYLHKPIYQHEERLEAASDASERLSIDSSISQYVEASEVIKDGLKPFQLVQKGFDILNEVRKRHGIS